VPYNTIVNSACTTYTQTTCPASHWGDASTSKCVPCAQLNEWSPTGSEAVSACVCAENFYNDGTTCVSCGASGTSVAGSTSAAACSCVENFYNDGTLCAPCGAGTSWAGSTGFASCTCDANAWSTSYACVALPGGTCPSGAGAASECTCAADHWNNGYSCMPTAGVCAAGTYGPLDGACTVGQCSAPPLLNDVIVTKTVGALWGGASCLRGPRPPPAARSSASMVALNSTR
jgi:hypothetical protein